LKLCHGYGNFQCSHCRFGTDNDKILAIHYSDFHASKSPLFFYRGNSPLNIETRPIAAVSLNFFILMHDDFIKFLSQPKITLPDQLSLHHLSLSLTEKCLIKYSPSKEMLANQGNINKLSKNYQIRMIYK
jgi:hypothetical protein